MSNAWFHLATLAALPVVALSLLSSFADAKDRDTGSGLRAKCVAALDVLDKQRSTSPTNAGFCLGYLQGVRDGMQIERTSSEGAAYPRVCIPLSARNDQLARVVVKYLDDNPAQLHEDAAHLTYAALVQAFPCPMR